MDMYTVSELKNEQSQKLTAAPSVIRAMEVLRMGRRELDEHIRQELIDNPVLENSEQSGDSGENISEERISDERYDIAGDPAGGSRQDPDSDPRDFMALATEEETLREHLLAQLRLTDISNTKKRIGEYIIESLDDNGIMMMTEGETAYALGISEEEVNELTEIIRTFEPYGVCAADRVDSLLIQLRALGMETDGGLYERLLRECAPYITTGDLDGASTALGIGRDELNEMMDILRSLDSSPGRGFSSARDAAYIIPDVKVEGDPSDPSVSEINNRSSDIRVSGHYRKMLEDAKRRGDDEAAEYLENMIRRAEELIRAAEARREMILKLAGFVVKRQSDFFRSGVIGLKTLTMKEAAEEIGVSISTVSRAANSKYIQTDRGVFALRYFFAGGVTDNTGRGISKESIKARIAKLVDAEDGARPMSDRKIAEMLSEDNMLISRRTVAKYREEAGIAASSKRKKK